MMASILTKRKAKMKEAEDAMAALTAVRTVKIDLRVDGSTDGDSIIEDIDEAEWIQDDSEEKPGSEAVIAIEDPTAKPPAEDKEPQQHQQQRRRSSLISRVESGLNNERVDIAEAGLRSQLSRLNKLLKLDTSKSRQRIRFCNQMLELISKNPKLAHCRFKIDGFEEPLLHQVICKQPSVELVSLIYAYNPAAAIEKGFGDYTVLHHACLCHNSKDVIQFLVRQEPLNLQARPFPPLFCAIDHQTDLEVLETLVKAWPDALCTCDIGSVTPLDVALMDKLPLPVIQLFVSYHPRKELKVSERGGFTKMHPEVASIFATDHPIIQSLDATNMRFTPLGWVSFFKLMTFNGTLRELRLNLTEAEVDPDVCDALNSMMLRNDCLEHLSISGRILPTAFANAIISGLGKNVVLKEFAIFVHLHFMNVEGLIRNCTNHSTLTKLTVRHCVAEGTNWTGLSNLLLLEKLDLNDCKIGSALSEPIALLITKSHKLKELSIARNNIGHEGTMLITKALEQNNILEFLDYSQNGIGETGWLAFIAILKRNNTSLRHVGFSLDDAFYDTYNQQLLYYCDQNSLGRTLIPKSPNIMERESSEEHDSFSGSLDKKAIDESQIEPGAD